MNTNDFIDKWEDRLPAYYKEEFASDVNELLRPHTEILKPEKSCHAGNGVYCYRLGVIIDCNTLRPYNSLHPACIKCSSNY